MKFFRHKKRPEWDLRIEDIGPGDPFTNSELLDSAPRLSKTALKQIRQIQHLQEKLKALPLTEEEERKWRRLRRKKVTLEQSLRPTLLGRVLSDGPQRVTISVPSDVNQEQLREMLRDAFRSIRARKAVELTPNLKRLQQEFSASDDSKRARATLKALIEEYKRAPGQTIAERKHAVASRLKSEHHSGKGRPHKQAPPRMAIQWVKNQFRLVATANPSQSRYDLACNVYRDYCDERKYYHPGWPQLQIAAIRKLTPAKRPMTRR